MSDKLTVGREQEALLVALSAVDELFVVPEGTVTVRIMPEDEDGNDLEPIDKEVKFKACKMKHLGPLTEMIQGMISGLADGELVKVLEYVSGEQQKKLVAGEDPYQLDTEKLVADVANSGALLSKLLGGALEILPRAITLFTNITREEWDDIDPASASVVAYGIFARNYSFFIQNGHLLHRAFASSLMTRLTIPAAKAKQ